MKQCLKCKEIKNKSEFGKQKGRKDELNIYCKFCIKKCAWLRRNPDSLITYEEFLQQKEDIKLLINVKYCSKCKNIKEFENFSKRKNTKDGLNFWCKECESKNASRYYKKHKDKIKKATKQWNEENKEKKKKIDKIYCDKNKIAIMLKKRIYSKKRRKNDVYYSLKLNVSHSINEALKKSYNSKNGLSCLQFLPYTIQELKEHLEKQFEPWMNWNNHGLLKNDGVQKWQIDHIIPHSSFHYESMDCEEFRKCWALENLRPLEAFANRLKGNK